MKYTVTIKDNESGEIIQELECNAIIGGVSMGDGGSASLINVSCTVGELLAAYKASEKAMFRVVEDNPLVLLLSTVVDLKEKEDSENA